MAPRTTAGLWRTVPGTAAFLFRRLPKNPAEGAFERCVSRLNAEAMEDGFSPSVPFPSMALEWELCVLCAVCVREIGYS